MKSKCEDCSRQGRCEDYPENQRYGWEIEECEDWIPEEQADPRRSNEGGGS